MGQATSPSASAPVLSRSLNSPLPPTPLQRSAVQHLNSLKPPLQHQTILDWLEATRKIWGELQQRLDLPGPTENEFGAFLTLISAENDSVCQWLRRDQYLPPSDHVEEHQYSGTSSSPSSPSSLSSSRKSHKSWRTSSGPSTARSSVLSFEPKRRSGLRHEYNREKKDGVAQDSDVARPLPESVGSVGAPKDTPKFSSFTNALDKKYHCLSGDCARFSTDDIGSLERHEMEQHVNRFYCPCKETPLRKMTELGMRCSFCETVDPDDSHFDQHNLHSCSKLDKRKFIKREGLFFEHLTTKHNITERAMEQLLQSSSWSFPIRKTAFSCGLCDGQLLDSKEGQLSHLKDHFEKGQDMRRQDINKIIRSLLRHPSVNPAWNRLLNNNLVDQSCINWDSTVINSESLPLELDLGSYTAESFAEKFWKYYYVDKNNRHLDNTRHPLQVTTHDITASAPGPARGYMSPSSPYAASPGIGAIEAISDSYSQERDSQTPNEIKMMDYDAVMSPMPVSEDQRSVNLDSLPLRLDSLNRNPLIASQYARRGNHQQMEITKAPPGNTQHLTNEYFDPSFSSMGSPTSGFNQPDASQGVFPSSGYGGPPSDEPYHSIPHPQGSSGRIAPADARPQPLYSTSTSLPGQTGPQRSQLWHQHRTSRLYGS